MSASTVYECYDWSYEQNFRDYYETYFSATVTVLGDPDEVRPWPSDEQNQPEEGPEEGPAEGPEEEDSAFEFGATFATAAAMAALF